MGAAVPKRLLYLPQLTLCLLLASVTTWSPWPQLSPISSNEVHNCWADFLRLLALVLGVFWFSHGMLLSLSGWWELYCLGIPLCRLATHEPGFTLGFRCLLICCFLASASFPSLLLHPTSSPVTASYGNGAAFPLASSQILHTGAIFKAFSSN